MTKIDIFSGFLGAGKTTLIKKLIAEAYVGQRVVLIENEFGEIAVDGGFLKDAGIEITEMNSGCICCSLVGDFSKSLQEVLEKFKPDRILIEPSGVGKLSDVVGAVSGVISETVVLNSTAAVVDVTKCKMYMKNFGEFFNNQVENAGCIILSRTGSCTPKQLEQALSLLKEKNPNAVLITTPWEMLSGKEILKAMERENSLNSLLHEITEEQSCPVCSHVHSHDDHHHEHHDEECCAHDHHHEHHKHHHHDGECCCGHDHAHHHADEVFGDWGAETARCFTAEEIQGILEALDDSGKYGMILRAKGFVPGEKEWIYFDYVPGEGNVRTGQPAVTGRICVIGANLNTNALKELFGI